MEIQKESMLEYNPGFFELPFKKAADTSYLSKGWCQMTIYFALGTICFGIFAFLLVRLDANVDWFTAFYFVGGLGWVPAFMCGLSHAYYKMCQKIYQYLDADADTLMNSYKESSTLIFGYLKGGSFNVGLSIFIWVAMLITVIINNATFNTEYINAAKIIYIFYLFVGLVFTIVPCAAYHFICALQELKQYKFNNHALYCGGIECAQTISRNCSLLIWSIVILLGLLAFAMLKSPYHETLWIWLPPFGIVPLMLFICNYQLKKALISSALHQEEESLQREIRAVLTDTSNYNTLQRIQNIHTLLGFQNKLRTYCRSGSTLAASALLFFTILGSLGSVVAALIPVRDFIQSILPFS